MIDQQLKFKAQKKGNMSVDSTEFDLSNKKPEISGVQKFYQSKGMETNFAPGFIDLNPNYTECRRNRIKALANKWQDVISNSLI